MPNVTQNRPSSPSPPPPIQRQYFDVPDKPGLHLAYSIDDHAGDIIFIHGLGGSPRKTWSRGNGAFWPHWLSADSHPSQPAGALPRFRVWSFGYNAKFKGPQTNLEITDFAKDLLLYSAVEFCVKRVSKTPILLVAHSMGGLIAKKTCAMLSNANNGYQVLEGRIKGIVFLATPHRGSQYAGTLNNVLTVAPFAGSSQPYVAELAAQSAVVQSIASEFQDEASKMLLCSFYETKKMKIGFTSIMVVEEASSVMGYSHELSYGLNADHRSICKFRNQNEESYFKIRSVLKLWTGYLTSKGLDESRDYINGNHGWVRWRAETFNPMRVALLTRQLFADGEDKLALRVQYLLGIETIASSKITKLGNDMKLSQAGAWSLSKRLYAEWMRTTEPIYWLVGAPGTGKSTIANFMAEHFRVAQYGVQVFSFQQQGAQKRTFSDFMQEMAGQLAMTRSDFRQKLFDLQADGTLPLQSITLTVTKTMIEIIKSALLALPQSKPLVWVLDNVEESAQPEYLLDELEDIAQRCAIRIFVTNRPILAGERVAMARQRLLQPADTRADMETYVANAVQQLMPHESAQQEFLRKNILDKAEGSFAWVKSVIEQLARGTTLQKAMRDNPLSDLAKSLDSPQPTMKLDGKLKKLLFGARLKLHGAVRWPDASIWHLSGQIDVITPQGLFKTYMLKTTKKGRDGRGMCRGRFESLKAMHAVKPDFCPKPYAWGRLSEESGSGYFILSEFRFTLDWTPPPFIIVKSLADLHLRSKSPTGKFGFHVRTYNGQVSQAVDFWHESWCVVFRAHLAHYFEQANPLFKGTGFALLSYLVLQKVVPRLLLPLQQNGRRLKPSLVHGGMWGTNTGVSGDTAEAMAFGGACFYGHSEYDYANWGTVRNNFPEFQFEDYYREHPMSRPRADWLERFKLYSLPFGIAQFIANPCSRERRDAIMDYLVEALADHCFDAIDGVTPVTKRLPRYIPSSDSEEEEEEPKTPEYESLNEEEEGQDESEEEDDDSDADFVCLNE